MLESRTDVKPLLLFGEIFMKLYGVFVGVNDYRDNRIRNLQFAAHDAKQFHRIVSDRISKDESKTWLLTNQRATRDIVIHTIGTELAYQVNNDDIVLLYFSCHGSPETTPQVDNLSRYLILHDTDYSRIFATGIDLERTIPRLLERISAKLILVFIDSCFSGMAGGRTFEGPNLKNSGLTPRGVLSLKELELGEGRIILAACGDNEVALEDRKLGHGVFTFQLLRILTDSRSGNVSVGVGNLYEMVKELVKNYTSNRQCPILNGRISDARIPILP